MVTYAQPHNSQKRQKQLKPSMLASIAVEANKSSRKALERVLKEKGASERRQTGDLTILM